MNNNYLDRLFSAKRFTDIHQAVSFISRFSSPAIFAEFNKILYDISPDDETFLNNLLHILDEYPHKIDMLISSLAMYSYSTEISDFQNTLNILRRYITHIPKNHDDYSGFLNDISQVDFSDEDEIQKFIITNKVKNEEPEITPDKKKNHLDFLKKFPIVNFFNKIIAKNKSSEDDTDGKYVPIKSDAAESTETDSAETNEQPSEHDGYSAYKSMIERIGYEDSVVADNIISQSYSSSPSTDSLLQEETEDDDDTFVSLKSDGEEDAHYSPISFRAEDVVQSDETKSSGDDFVSSDNEENQAIEQTEEYIEPSLSVEDGQTEDGDCRVEHGNDNLFSHDDDKLQQSNDDKLSQGDDDKLSHDDDNDLSQGDDDKLSQGDDNDLSQGDDDKLSQGDDDKLSQGDNNRLSNEPDDELTNDQIEPAIAEDPAETTEANADSQLSEAETPSDETEISSGDENADTTENIVSDPTDQIESESTDLIEQSELPEQSDTVEIEESSEVLETSPAEFDETEKSSGDETEKLFADETEKSSGDETEKSSGDETEKSSGDETEKSSGDETEKSSDDETEKSSDDETEKSSGDEIEKSSGDETEKSSDDETEKLSGDEIEKLSPDETEKSSADDFLSSSRLSVRAGGIESDISKQRIEYRNRIIQALLDVYHDKKTGYKLMLGLFRGLDVFRRMCLTGEEFNKDLFMRNFRKYLTHFPDANLITLCHEKVPDIDESIISQHIIGCMKVLNHHVDKTRFKLLFDDKLNLRSGFNWEYQQRITWLYFPEKRKPKRDIDEIYAVKSVTDSTASKTENTKVKKYRSYISMLSNRDITLANQILGVLHTIYYKRRDCKRFLFHIFKSLDEYDLSAFELTPKQKAIFEANFNKTVLNTNKNPDYPNIFKMIVQNIPKIKPREIESLLPICIRIMKEKIDIGFERKKRKQPDLANSFNPLEKYSQIYEKKLFIIYKTV